MMRECSSCPKFQTCTELCQEMKDQLPPEDVYNPPDVKRMSEVIPPDTEAEDSEEMLDNKLSGRNKKSPITPYEDFTKDLMGQQDSIFDTARPSLTGDGKRWLDKYLDRGFRKKDGKKYKGYFKSFLECDDYKKIAKKAGCSVANISKRFSTALKIIAETMVGDGDVRGLITGERMGKTIQEAHEKLKKKESIDGMIKSPKDIKEIYSEYKRAIVK